MTYDRGVIRRETLLAIGRREVLLVLLEEAFAVNFLFVVGVTAVVSAIAVAVAVRVTADCTVFSALPAVPNEQRVFDPGDDSDDEFLRGSLNGLDLVQLGIACRSFECGHSSLAP
jgi:hypothetical protein